MINKNLLYVLSVILLFSTTASAKKYSDQGAYGSLNFIYGDESYKYGDSENKQTNLAQEYKLGYKGNIYSPRLLEYTLDGTIRYEEYLNEGSSESRTESESQDYSINVGLIQSTKAPIFFYLQKSNRPTSTIYGNTINRYQQDSENKGVRGSLNLNYFAINYSYNIQKGIFDSNTTTEYRDTKQFISSINKNEKNYNLKLGFSRIEQDNKKDILDENSTSTSESNDKIDFAYRVKINDDFSFNTSTNYLKSKYLKSQSISSNAGLNWSPKKKYSASVALGASTVTSYNSINYLSEESVQSKMKSYNASQTFTYRILDNLRVTQGSGYTYFESFSNKGKNLNLNFTTSYNKKISNDLRMNLSGSVSQMSNTVTVENEFESNETTTSTNGLTLLAGFSQDLDVINSNLISNLSYSTLVNNFKETRSIVGVSMSLNSRFYYIFTNNASIGYSSSDSTTVDKTDSSLFHSKVDSIYFNDNLRFSRRLGIRGNIDNTLGITYSMINNNGVKIIRKVPSASINLQYRFFQRVMYGASFSVSKDLSYDYLTYTLSNSIDYKIGKTSLSLIHKYNKVESSGESIMPQQERYRLEARLSRTF